MEAQQKSDRWRLADGVSFILGVELGRLLNKEADASVANTTHGTVGGLSRFGLKREAARALL